MSVLHGIYTYRDRRRRRKEAWKEEALVLSLIHISEPTRLA